MNLVFFLWKTPVMCCFGGERRAVTNAVKSENVNELKIAWTT